MFMPAGGRTFTIHSYTTGCRQDGSWPITGFAVRSRHGFCGWCVGRYASAAIRDWSEPAPATSNSAPELTGFCVGGCVVHCFFDNGAITAQSGMGTVVGGCVLCPAGMLLETEGVTKCLSGGSCSWTGVLGDHLGTRWWCTELEAL